MRIVSHTRSLLVAEPTSLEDVYADIERIAEALGGGARGS
jgi:hypothetical protein